MLVSELFLWKAASRWFGAISSFYERVVGGDLAGYGFLLIAYAFSANES
jgi:hypothetical protein